MKKKMLSITFGCKTYHTHIIILFPSGDVRPNVVSIGDNRRVIFNHQPRPPYPQSAGRESIPSRKGEIPRASKNRNPLRDSQLPTFTRGSCYK